MYSLCLSRYFSAHYDAVITVLIMKLLFSRKQLKPMIIGRNKVKHSPSATVLNISVSVPVL
jgi:hypothetical protein